MYRYVTLKSVDRPDVRPRYVRAIFVVSHMTIPFSKWQGTGNDFIVIDDRAGTFSMIDEPIVRRLCDRHFGIGSDGLIVVRSPKLDGTAFHMEFLNPDGSRSFCGNGSRCAFAFWRQLQEVPCPVGMAVLFSAYDGEHRAMTLPDGHVAIAMKRPRDHERASERMDLWNTGSPHVVLWVDDPERVDVVTEGRKVRNSERYGVAGVNVNFTAMVDGVVHMRTYERGVEDETLSCGTGVTAAALSARSRGLVSTDEVPILTRGGELRVDLRDGDGSGEVLLCGPAVEVFSGSITI